MSEFRAQGIVKRFRIGDRELEVLRGVDLKVAPGESVAILGVSGAGKSTLLHILGGLEHPSQGTVEFGGENLYTMDPPRLATFRNQTLGFVFQFHHLLPEFSALENVMLPGLLGGVARPAARERAEAMLASVGLSERRTHPPGKLSGGERQRVAIARALVSRPSVLLADEPTGNLDPYTAGAVEDLLLRLNGETGTSLVLVTHNEKLARRLDKQLYLVDGQLQS
jgi:lipoprotein-releasing system ATP-binding protein